MVKYTFDKSRIGVQIAKELATYIFLYSLNNLEISHNKLLY